jgi:tetratricopeptide (TPR) repeat protein
MMQEAADANGGDAETYARVGAMYEDLELLERAQATYEKLAALQTDDEQVRTKLDEVRLLNRDRTARQRWLNSVQLNFDRDEAPTGHPPSCAEAARTWNDYDRGGRIGPEQLRAAAELYEKSIAAKSDDMHAYLEAATIYEALGDYPRASSIWQRGLDLAPGNPTATAALRRLELLAALDGEDLDAAARARTFDELGKLLMLGGEFERALPHLESALEIMPDDPALWASVGGALDGAADFQGAIEAFERAIELERDDLRLTTVETELNRLRRNSKTSASATRNRRQLRSTKTFS